MTNRPQDSFTHMIVIHKLFTFFFIDRILSFKWAVAANIITLNTPRHSDPLYSGSSSNSISPVTAVEVVNLKHAC